MQPPQPPPAEIPPQEFAAAAFPAPGELFDGLLSFSGPTEEFSLLLMASVFSNRLLLQAVIFQTESGESAPVLVGAFPPLPRDAEPEWLNIVIATLPSNDSRTKIIPRKMAAGRSSMPTKLGIKSLDPNGNTYLAFEMKHQNQVELPAFMMNLEVAGALWRAFKRRMDGGDAEALAPAVSLMSAVNPHKQFPKYAMSLCNEMASRFGCDRVSLGILRGRYVRVAAISHTEKFGKGMELVQAVEAAMEECLDQDAEIVFPGAPGSSFINRAAGELSNRFDGHCIVGIPVRDGEKPAGVLTLERSSPFPPDPKDIVLATLRNNHDIKIASHKPEQAKTGIMEAKAIYDPVAFADWQHSMDNNPESRPYSQAYDSVYRKDTERVGVRQHLPSGADLSAYREWTQGSEKVAGHPPNRGSGGAYAVELSQPLLRGFGDKETRTVLQITRLQIEQSEEELRQTIIQSLGDAMEEYWTVAQQKEEISIQEETLAMAEDLLNRERERQSKGVSTPLDVHRAEEAVATRRNILYQMREQERVSLERLKLFMNSPTVPVGADDVIVVAENLETPLLRADLDQSIQTALANRPEMRNADLAIRTGEARRGFARHNLLPELSVGGSVRRNDSNNSTPVSTSHNDLLGNDWSVGVSFSVPLGNMESRARLRRSESELAQSIDEKLGVKSAVITEVKTAVQNLELLVSEIPICRQAVDAARKVVAGEWARFELNQVGNRDLLQAQDLLATAQRSHIQSLARYNIALVRLFEAEGTLAEKLGCEFK